MCYAEADTAIETSMYDMTGTWHLVDTQQGQHGSHVLVCNPTDAYPHSFRSVATGAVYLEHFRMRRQRLEWQNPVAHVANLKP